MAELLTGLRVATGDLTGQLMPLSVRIEFIFELIRGRLAGPRVAPLIDPDLVTAGHELARALVRTGPTALVHGDLHLANMLIAYQPGQPGQPRRLVAIDPRPGLGDPDFDAVDWVLAPGATQTPEQQVRQRIEELGSLVPGLDGDRLWAWCQASAIIIVVQHLHNRPADSRIPFLLQLAAR
jgi:streptomycin 6-kinase